MNEKCVKCNNILSGLVFHDKDKNFVCNDCATEKPYTYPTGEFRKVKEQGESLVEAACPCENQSRDECQLCRDLNTSRDWERMYHKAHALVNLQSIQIHTLVLEKAELQKLLKGNGSTGKKRSHK